MQRYFSFKNQFSFNFSFYFRSRVYYVDNEINSTNVTTLLANNIGAILAQYRRIGSTSANITILGQCWCDIE